MTQRGPRTISDTVKKIAAPMETVFLFLCDFRSWNKWISPQSRFESSLNFFDSKGDACTEYFGLFGTSEITWTVRDINKPLSLVVYSSSSKGTFGWDELELDFLLSPAINEQTKSPETILQLKYSWTVLNPAVALIERSLIRENMLSDTIQALYRFAYICEKK